MRFQFKSTKISRFNDPLVRSSIILTVNRGLNAFCGFIFWIIAAKFYSINEVGLATAFISALNLVLLISRFGFDTALIRFLPIDKKDDVYSTSINITVFASCLISLLFLLGIHFFSKKMDLILNIELALVFVIIGIVNSLAFMTGITFIAFRQSEKYLLQNIFLSSRVIFLFLFSFLGVYGLIVSIGTAYLIASIISIIIIGRSIEYSFKINKPFIKKNLNYSLDSYLSNLFTAIPALIMPIMVLNILSESDAAKFFIAFSISNLILIIPDTLSTSIFVEGSHGRNLRKNVYRAGAMILIFMVPAIIIIIVFGEMVLGFMGENYVESISLLRLLALSSLFSTIYMLFSPIQRVRLNTRNLAKVNLLGAILLIGLSYIFIIMYGVIGIAYAWICAYSILDIVIIMQFEKEGWIKI